ncbi:alpha/beta hydrolase-fold protein [Flavisolibacter tropicus]|uniref:alpha/beta hydrolase-fold protein n=1 Tax=Flavisolibacter tropicus TaxID=1492898 RepID=UPI0008299FF7|nr:alpha/beta hydrolase-fold protein [Flavisolibacter tropicus]
MKKVLGFLSLLGIVTSLSAQTKIYLHLDTSVHQTLTGRLLLFTTTDTVKGVPDQPNYKQPVFAVNVTNWKKDSVLVIDQQAEAFSTHLQDLPTGYYKIAAFMDAHPEERGGYNVGNVYSRKNALLHIKTEGVNEAHLYMDGQIKPRPFKENDSLKLLELKSSLLSSFHHKDVFVKGAVILPAGYDANSTQTYPVVYIIPGWGGTHFDAMSSGPRKRYGIGMGQPKIYVYLNPETQTPWGLHAFVDSRVNGPWGKALVNEVIPYIQKNYHGTTSPNQTFVMGQSSGGYPSLWLLLNYPKAFGGGWAISPDPVDFSNFSGIDFYAKDVNFYTYNDGTLVPYDMRKGQAQGTMKQNIQIELFSDDGGQQVSFEAEYGKLGTNGRPQPLFDRITGRIDKQVLANWKVYDMGLFIQKHWKKMDKDLKGKIHVYAGAEDNFFLNKSVEAFKAKADKLQADMVVEVIPGADHWSIWSESLTKRLQSEIDTLIIQNKSRDSRSL